MLTYCAHCDCQFDGEPVENEGFSFCSEACCRAAVLAEGAGTGAAACTNGNHRLPTGGAHHGRCPECGVELHYGMTVDAPRGASYGWREGPPRPPRRVT